MRRRVLLAASAALGASIASPALIRAQPRLPRIGLVSPSSERTVPPPTWIDERFRELGYVDGKNSILDFVYLGTRFAAYRQAFDDLVARKADVLLALGPEVALRAAQAASTAVPIVMLAIDYDPLALGYVKSLARPGGNITGVFLQQIELAEKRTELLKQVFPDLKAAAVLWDAPSAPQWRAIDRLAPTLGLDVIGIEMGGPPYDYDAALARIPADHRDVLIVPTSPVFFFDRERLGASAARHRLPMIAGAGEWAVAGGLISYGPSFKGMFRRSVDYVDRILKGARAAELPVEQPTNFELIVNLKVARALGIAIPPTILARADEVIE